MGQRDPPDLPDVDVRFRGDFISSPRNRTEITVARTGPSGEDFEKNVQKTVYNTVRNTQVANPSGSQVFPDNLTEAIVGAIRSHPEFPVWDVHSA